MIRKPTMTLRRAFALSMTAALLAGTSGGCADPNSAKIAADKGKEAIARKKGDSGEMPGKSPLGTREK